MPEINKKVFRSRLTVKQIEDIGVARKKGESPVVIAVRMSLSVMQVRNVITALGKRGVQFPALIRATQSKYIDIAKKLL
jgi:hypothetical protein